MSVALKYTIDSARSDLATMTIENYERGGGEARETSSEYSTLDDFAVQLIDFALEPTVDKLNALERDPGFEDKTMYTNFFYEGLDGVQISLYDTKRVRHYASLHGIHVGHYGMNTDPVICVPLRLILNTKSYTIQDQGESKTVWRAKPHPVPPPPSPSY